MITSEILGKLGGAGVEETPASASLSGKGTQVLHTVNIPPGETWLVAVIGTGTGRTTYIRDLPRINIGGTIVEQVPDYFASAAIMSESGDVIFECDSIYSSSFEGNIYTVKM